MWCTLTILESLCPSTQSILYLQPRFNLIVERVSPLNVLKFVWNLEVKLGVIWCGSPKIKLDNAPSIFSETITLKCNRHEQGQEMFSLVPSLQFVSITQREGEIDWRLLCVHEFLLCEYNSQNTDPNPSIMDLRTMEDPFVSSLRISGSSSGFPDPLNPIFTGTAGISVFYGRYQWHQSIIRYHLLYFNLIPQHPVPLAFTGSRPLDLSLHGIPTTCPSYHILERLSPSYFSIFPYIS